MLCTTLEEKTALFILPTPTAIIMFLITVNESDKQQRNKPEVSTSFF